MEGIQVSTEVAGSQNQISIIKVGGFIDTTTSSEVERALNSLLKQGRYKIIIDLGNVDYISSAGWGIFISEIKSIREHDGDLKLVRMIPDVYEIFELLEFHHILDVYDSVEEAIRKFEEGEARPATPTAAPAAAKKEQLSFAQAGASHTTGTPPTETISKPPVAEEQPLTTAETGSVPSKEGESSLRFKSIEDKIKDIVAKNPNIGAWKINKLLNTQQYGFTKVGWFGVRAILNKMGLNSRKNRRKFALTYLQTQMKGD